jgi:hypothetical protein
MEWSDGTERMKEENASRGRTVKGLKREMNER